MQCHFMYTKRVDSPRRIIFCNCNIFSHHNNCSKINSNFKILVPPGLEPGTFRVLSERDNHYTTELADFIRVYNVQISWCPRGDL